ncbi:DUF2381 family protein, partial [Corallococcus exiguus]
SPPARQLRQRALSLLSSPVDASVQVAKGTLTTLTFDSPLLPKSVVVQGRDTHFERFVVEERTVTLKPKVDLADDERLLLTVRFADGAAPQEVIFVLVPASDQVDAAVEVLRRARSAEALQQELAQVQAQLSALQGRCGDGGPSGLIFSGLLDPSVSVKELDKDDLPENANGLKLERGHGLQDQHLGSRRGSRTQPRGSTRLECWRCSPRHHAWPDSPSEVRAHGEGSTRLR